MKTIAILFVCAFMACLFIEGKADCPPLKDPSGTLVKTGTKSEQECAIFICQDNGAWTSSGCGVWQCQPGQKIGYRERNDKKLFPECCAGPICKPSES